MENFNTEIAEILEVETVKLSQTLESFDCWDSLTILSIIAMADEKYGVILSAADVQNAKTVGGLMDLIKSKQ
jgi:acyl carrier protein